MCESSHQANMQIIIGLKWKQGKMFRNGGKGTPCTSVYGGSTCPWPPAAARRMFVMLLRKSVRAHSVAHSVL